MVVLMQVAATLAWITHYLRLTGDGNACALLAKQVRVSAAFQIPSCQPRRGYFAPPPRPSCLNVTQQARGYETTVF